MSSSLLCSWSQFFGQGGPQSSLPSATSLLSCLIQSKLACGGLFATISPVNKESSVSPALTHHSEWNAQRRPRSVKRPWYPVVAADYCLWQVLISSVLWFDTSAVEAAVCRSSVRIMLQRFLLSSPPP